MKTRPERRRALLVFMEFGLSAAILTGCGGGSGSSALMTSSGVGSGPPGEYLYAGDHDTGAISGFAIDKSTGALTPVAGSPYAITGPNNIVGSGSIAVDPTGHFLFAGAAYLQPFPPTQPQNLLYVYSIDASTGVLNNLAGSPFALPLGVTSVTALAVDPSGEFLYAGVEMQGIVLGGIVAFSINSSSGVPSMVPGSPFAVDSAGYSIAMATSTKEFLFAEKGVLLNGASQTAGVAQFSIDSQTGALTALTDPSIDVPGANGAPMVGDPAGPYVYVNGTGGSVLGFSIDATSGALTAIPGSPFSGGDDLSAESGMAIDSAGDTLYIANCSGPNAGNLSVSSIDPHTGGLTQIAGSPFATGACPYSVAVDPQDKFVYVANANDGTVTAFSIGQPGGSLAAISGSPYAVGGSDPGPEHLAVAMPQ